MTPLFSLRLPPLRRPVRGKAVLALIVFVIALLALAAPPPGAAYSCTAGEGRMPANRVDDCRGPVKVEKRPKQTQAAKDGRIGATSLLLLLLALGGTLAVPVGFDRMTRKGELEPDRLLR
jgi:hypothetical protein